jgi:signal transduction histidine kinase
MTTLRPGTSRRAARRRLIQRPAVETAVAHAPGSARLSPFVATRRRLVAINLLVVSAILAVMAVAVYISDAHAIDQQINQQLVTWAEREPSGDSLTTTLPSGGTSGESSDAFDLTERYEPSSPNVFALVLNSEGEVVSDPGRVTTLGLPDSRAAGPVLAGSVASTLVTVGHEPNQFRLYTVPLRSHGTIVGALQIGISLEARERQLHDLLVTLGLVGLGVLVLTAGASVYLAERALVPARLAFERQRQFAAAASHELRTPLAIVRSQADLVTRRLRRAGEGSGLSAENSRDATQDVQEITEEVDYMTRLVHDLLLLARDEHLSRGQAWQRVDLGTVANGVVEKLRPTADAYGVALRRTASAGTHDEAACVRGDADRLRQLVLILLENALRYTPRGGSVEVDVVARPGHRLFVGHRGHVELTVRDTGVGIAPEDQARIFEPFYRSPAARVAGPDGGEQRGAGLGLALAQWIARAHDGSISVESALGVGSTFSVHLPLAPASDEP